MGARGSKLLLPLAGAPLVERTVRVLAGADYVDQVVLIVPESERERFESLNLERAADGAKFFITTGGATRQESVMKGLQFCAGLIEDEERTYIAVHDGARCLVTKEIVDRAVAAAFERQAVTVAVPMVDSLKRTDAGGRVIESLERDGVWAVQTPQVFRYSLLLEAHRRGGTGACDDASLVEAIHPVHVVEGSRLNFKITTPEDYQLAKGLIGPSSIASPS